MGLEQLTDQMTGLQMANVIRNNFDKVLDAESAENKAENAGLSIKTDYDATRYIDLQLADGTPVKMKMDTFCQAIAPVVAGLMNPIKQKFFNPCSWDILRDYGLTLPNGSSAWFSSTNFANNGLMSSKPEGMITRVADAGVLRVFFTTMEVREYTIHAGTWGDIRTAKADIS